jgi:hypothetical protein
MSTNIGFQFIANKPCLVAELWVTAEAISTNAGWGWTAYSCVCNVFLICMFSFGF